MKLHSKIYMAPISRLALTLAPIIFISTSAHAETYLSASAEVVINSISVFDLNLADGANAGYTLASSYEQMIPPNYTPYFGSSSTISLGGTAAHGYSWEGTQRVILPGAFTTTSLDITEGFSHFRAQIEPLRVFAAGSVDQPLFQTSFRAAVGTNNWSYATNLHLLPFTRVTISATLNSEIDLGRSSASSRVTWSTASIWYNDPTLNWEAIGYSDTACFSDPGYWGDGSDCSRNPILSTNRTVQLTIENRTDNSLFTVPLYVSATGSIQSLSSPVPENSTLALLSLGIAILLLRRK